MCKNGNTEKRYVTCSLKLKTAHVENRQAEDSAPIFCDRNGERHWSQPSAPLAFEWDQHIACVHHQASQNIVGHSGASASKFLNHIKFST